MNQFIILFSIIFSLNFIQTKHPLAMGLNLLIQTILISLLCGFMSYTYWFSYVLFLTMLGGMLVLFLYVTSLASNELFSFNMLSLLLMISFTMIMSIILIFNDKFIWLISNLETINFNMINNLENENNLIKLYNNPTMNVTLLMIIYLFLTLIIVVKITDINYGPLRQSY
uniref:NADH-ubiquinone oxidoreductase chain 6 n=1 Tax=Chrysoperla nipponensis TaxID=413239 RepID=E6N2M2_CHRNP|nr:NADH dehydrogenase subunit 6 [Chrysoperla nipponensis]ARO47929.1 NADH dehydrogenase subunit 6 [Chrysoperla nipponensis]BAJ61131.1 NADH dehydrogenase subunit 6 [Chrysoperla nipponensis]